MRGGERILRNRAARNCVPASRMRVGLHGLEQSHAVSKSRYPSLTKKASTAAFPTDFRKTEYYTAQRSRLSETQTRFAVFITRMQRLISSWALPPRRASEKSWRSAKSSGSWMSCTAWWTSCLRRSCRNSPQGRMRSIGEWIRKFKSIILLRNGGILWQ